MMVCMSSLDVLLKLSEFPQPHGGRRGGPVVIALIPEFGNISVDLLNAIESELVDGEIEEFLWISISNVSEESSLPLALESDGSVDHLADEGLLQLIVLDILLPDFNLLLPPLYVCIIPHGTVGIDGIGDSSTTNLLVIVVLMGTTLSIEKHNVRV